MYCINYVYMYLAKYLHYTLTCTAGSPTTEREQTFGDLAAAAMGNDCLHTSIVTVLLNIIIQRLPNNINVIINEFNTPHRSWSSSYKKESTRK